MIVNEFKIGNTKILVDNTYLPKTEDERNKRYELFNNIACEILYNSKS